MVMVTLKTGTSTICSTACSTRHKENRKAPYRRSFVHNGRAKPVFDISFYVSCFISTACICNEPPRGRRLGHSGAFMTQSPTPGWFVTNAWTYQCNPSIAYTNTWSEIHAWINDSRWNYYCPHPWRASASCVMQTVTTLKTVVHWPIQYGWKEGSRMPWSPFTNMV